MTPLSRHFVFPKLTQMCGERIGGRSVAHDGVCRVEGDDSKPEAESEFVEQRRGGWRQSVPQPCRHVRFMVQHAPRGQHVHETPRADTCEVQRLVKAKAEVWS